MSLRRSEDARLEATGWTVTVDSPGQRLPTAPMLGWWSR